MKIILNKILYFIQALLFYLCISFSLFARQRKRNAPKEKENTLLTYALRACLFIGIAPNLLASQTRYAQTMLGRKLASVLHSNISELKDSAKPNEKKTAERSEDVENICVFFLLLLLSFLLPFTSQIKGRRKVELFIKEEK